MSDAVDDTGEVVMFPTPGPLSKPPADTRRIGMMKATVAELLGRANALQTLQREALLGARPPDPTALVVESLGVIMRALAFALDEQLVGEGEPRTIQIRENDDGRSAS